MSEITGKIIREAANRLGEINSLTKLVKIKTDSVLYKIFEEAGYIVGDILGGWGDIPLEITNEPISGGILFIFERCR